MKQTYSILQIQLSDNEDGDFFSVFFRNKKTAKMKRKAEILKLEMNTKNNNKKFHPCKQINVAYNKIHFDSI